MILNVIIFKNVKIDCFTQPQFTDVEPAKAALQLARSLKINEDKEIDKKYQPLEMYDLGTFDDQTGECNLHDPELLLVCGSVIKARKKEEAKPEVVDYGQNQ